MQVIFALKNYYNVISFVLLFLSILTMFLISVKKESFVTSFEINNKIMGGTVNNNYNTKSKTDNNYLAILNIPKINLYKEFYDYESPLNTVEKNIEVIEKSKMPDIKNGNLILASHSGNSNIAYFKNLDKLKLKDLIFIHYNGKKYKYIVENIYDVKKTGYIEINRNKNKTTLTLITCKKNTNLQTVYVCYQIE